MKKFKLTWYEGCIEEIGTVIKEAIVECDDIMNVKINPVLPDEIMKKVMYERRTIFSKHRQSVDYGSWSKFVMIDEVL